MSWEQRRHEWKQSPPEIDKIDEWFHSFEPQKKPGIPEFAYNLDIPWKWEETAVEILGF